MVVPLQAHADPETFVVESGEVEGLALDGDDPTWVRSTFGDIFHVPGGARHAWRNPAREPVAMLIVSTAKMAHFFQELGTPVRRGETTAPPSRAMLRRFLETSERYGHWNASPEENARVGISLPAA